MEPVVERKSGQKNVERMPQQRRGAPARLAQTQAEVLVGIFSWRPPRTDKA